MKGTVHTMKKTTALLLALMLLFTLSACAAHFDAMKLMEKLEFTSLGANPLASFDEAVHG